MKVNLYHQAGEAEPSFCGTYDLHGPAWIAAHARIYIMDGWIDGFMSRWTDVSGADVDHPNDGTYWVETGTGLAKRRSRRIEIRNGKVV